MGKRINEHFNANIVLNMCVASFAAMFLGMFLKLFALPCWFICGMVAVGAVIAEHLLTVHPVELDKKLEKVYEKIKQKVSSWKN